MAPATRPSAVTINCLVITRQLGIRMRRTASLALNCRCGQLSTIFPLKSFFLINSSLLDLLNDVSLSLYSFICFLFFISLASRSLSSRSRCFCSLPLNFSSSVAPALCFLFLSVAGHRRRAVGSSLVSTLEQYAITSTRGQLPVVVRTFNYCSVTVYIFYNYIQTKVEISLHPRISCLALRCSAIISAWPALHG